MSFDWSDYLTLAKELEEQCLAGACVDAKRRSSISRAYYSVFCLARRYLTVREHLTTIPEDGTAHEVVENEIRLRSTRVAEDLHRLRIARNRADYDDDLEGLSGVCTKSLSRAETVAHFLKLRLGP